MSCSLESDADCHFGNHDYSEPRGATCRHCGETNYRLLGYYGAVASAAKRWGVSLDEAETRMTVNAIREDERRGLLDSAEASALIAEMVSA